MGSTYKADAVVVGGGLAGLTAALELLDSGRSVVLLEGGPESKLGGLARVSFGGVFIVGSPEQRRARIRDSVDLALRDWLSFGEHGVEDVTNLARFTMRQKLRMVGRAVIRHTFG